MNDAKLYLVPTPIGNLEDMTLRAIRVLKESDLILAEDTRTSSRLLQHFEIETPMQSHHMHNEHKILDRVLQRLKGEKRSRSSPMRAPREFRTPASCWFGPV